MTKEMMFEVGSAVVFCALAVLLINPTNFWMPTMAHMTVLTLAAVAFGAFVIFVLREHARDERDEEHRSAAGHAAFLAGSAVLIIGIAVQNVVHQVDAWLIGALIAMVVAKVGTRIWNTLYH